MNIPVENALAFYPASVQAGNVTLRPLTLAAAVRISALGSDLGERVPKGLLMQVAYELWDKRDTYTFRIFLRKMRCGLNELTNAVEKVLNDANETFVKPAQEAGATVSLTPHGLGWPLEYAEFLCSEYGMAFCDAIETPVARVFALYAAYRQRNGGRHAGFDYLERAYAKSAEFKNSPLT